MNKVTTSILIDPVIREEIQKAGHKLSYCTIRGWESIKGETGQSKRLQEAETTIMKLQSLITNINTKYWELKDTVDKK
jgi:hypothetical protein